MRRFEFRLEPALSLRRRLEEQAQVQLAESELQREREQAQLLELQRERERHERTRDGLQRQGLDVGALVDADRYGSALDRALQAQQERLLAARGTVDARRDALHQRHRDREAMERLRDRQLQEYRQEALRAEQAALDEAFVLRWKKG
jgi:flagellar export protein FliJ